MTLYNAIFSVSDLVDTAWAQNYFNNFVTFFDNNAGFTRIASYYGSGGTGFTSATGSNPSGYNRWAVWRKTFGQHSFDLWFGLAEDFASFPPTIDPSGSFNIGKYDNTVAGMGLIVAFHSSSAPWNGTTNNNGQDRFSHSSMWKSGSNILPSSNQPYGFNYPSQSIGVNILGNTISDVTGCIVLNEDNFAILNYSADFNNSFVFFENYSPRSSSFNLPYSLVKVGTTFKDDIIGKTSFVSNTNGGAFIKQKAGITSLSGSYGFTVKIPTGFSDPYSLTAIIPPSTSTLEFYKTPYSMLLSDYKQQYIGQSSFIQIAQKRFTAGHKFLSSSEIVIYKNTEYCFVCPWSSSFGILTGSGYINLVHTTSLGSLFSQSYAHTSESNLRNIQSVAGTRATYYRGLLAGSYVYGTTNPPAVGATNVIVIKK